MSSFMSNSFGMPVPPLGRAFTDPIARHEVVALLRDVGRSVGLDDGDADVLPNIVEQSLADSVHNAEDSIRQWITTRANRPELTAEMDARSAQICAQIAPFLRGGTIADIGCGDGLVAAGLKKQHEIFLIDVVAYVDTRVALPFRLYSGHGALPIDGKVDCSLLLTVLHHSEDPLGLIEETMRVTAKRIIVIESVVPERKAPDFDTQFIVAAFFDWFYNRVLHTGVPVPFNYNSVGGWKSIFERQGWRAAYMADLGRDQKLVPERHVLFVLDRVER